MRILYGVQATGNGHITRARVMARALAQHELEVDFLFSGRTHEQLFDMEEFGDFRCYRGLTFSSVAGRVSIPRTLYQAKFRQLLRDTRSLELNDYDLVLNDFEPITAWAARRQGLRCIGLSHQVALTQDVPKTNDGLSTRMLMRYFAPVSERVGVHWYHYGLSILPPIIDVQLSRKKATADMVLVYLPFESLTDIQRLLEAMPRHFSFYCFHPQVKHETRDQQIHFFPLDKSHFQRCLTDCEAVIANGGFELPSESLFLGKKLLVKPLRGQFEQETNVDTLRELGLASVMDRLQPLIVHDWLNSGPAQPMLLPDVAAALAQWLAEGAHEPLSQLTERLWQQVRYPNYVRLPRLAQAS